ncbi:MAG TPA: hypothetical protein VKS79_19585 [Gemmataceae bacterium]|nr:hypothetical protein [Gemmataceae bacterium]
MIIKKILGGVAIVGALALLPAAASAHDHYHYYHGYGYPYYGYYHGYYHNYYRPYYYAPTIVAPAPVVVAPVVGSLDVFYRGGIGQPWSLYGTYATRFDANNAAQSLESGGYSVMIQPR